MYGAAMLSLERQGEVYPVSRGCFHMAGYCLPGKPSWKGASCTQVFCLSMARQSAACGCLASPATDPPLTLVENRHTNSKRRPVVGFVTDGNIFGVLPVYGFNIASVGNTPAWEPTHGVDIRMRGYAFKSVPECNVEV